MKERLDILLVKRNLAGSREKAKEIIKRGNVEVNRKVETKAGSMVEHDAEIQVKEYRESYVSRGGYKLEKALNHFQISLKEKICLDIGASTGGFTDCMLQNGAEKVYAIDVGKNQLALKIRQDPRVISMERTNIRYVDKKEIPDEISFISVDVSFISLTKILHVIYELLGENGQVVCLVKPQFEAGKGKIGKKGVVKEKKVQEEVLDMVIEKAASIGFQILHCDFSPIKGVEGNIEYLLHLFKQADKEEIRQETENKQISQIVAKAHEKLK